MAWSTPAPAIAAAGPGRPGVPMAKGHPITIARNLFPARRRTGRTADTMNRPFPRGARWALVLAALLGSLFWYRLETLQRREMSYAGIPLERALTPRTFTRIFRNEGFLVGYSEWRANPLWVVYRLRPITAKRHFKRPARFRADPRSLRHIDHHDYSHSGYTRGHLAPNYAIANLYGRTAQLDTFLMTNVSPQRADLNRKLWQRLEEVEVDYFARWFGELWVVTGPVFDDDIRTLKSGVEIPDAFYKILVRPPRGEYKEPRMLAFLMPQKVRGDEPLDRYLVSVDEIERLTGFDFFHELDDRIEDKVEGSKSTRGWRLEEVARLPGRYY